MPHYETQYTRILDHMRAHDGKISSREAMNEYGIERLAARIQVLRSDGYKIRSESTAGVNRYGDKVHYTTYVLEEDS